jgi:3-(3-hydroxy-phenyl)propionate hydroxylase
MSRTTSPTPRAPRDRAPVAIAGAGPVGLSLALALARDGIRSIVVEKRADLDPRSRATVIVPRSLAFFERLGVLPDFLRQGQRNDAIRILRAPDRAPLLTFDFRPLRGEIATPYALALSQDRTERILLDAVRATGMVEVAFATPFERFEARPDGVRIRAGGRAVEASFLVGADGSHSAVRAQLGWRLEGKTYPTRAALADVRIDPERDTERGWLADPRGPSFIIAIRFADGVWRIIEAAVPASVGDADLAERARHHADGLFGRGAWRETLWTAAYRKHERRAARYAAGRVILAGDAAHLNSPAGGQGMNAGLADADRLARALADALDRPARAGALVGAYESERIAAFDRDVRGFTDALEAMEAAPAWLRAVGFSALGLLRHAGIERRVARRLAMLDPASA